MKLNDESEEKAKIVKARIEVPKNHTYPEPVIKSFKNKNPSNYYPFG